ncbi:TetR/AcrR family transcriptional regulator [Streptosporangium pseudovulgare]|uniref:TetR family transcriptional regulator n=1 Tax=Streptosporangium pseudovulgare TaxID=35765 RepID=A0ABQ2QQN6_9ACTN|nr:TetR/AcrR family transcriptional regulator [Streptosporangium pseudovulgare]GGP92684.1 TetR family transcriptional regulator [Streptosporangium pseudovulgare]
MRVSQAGEGRSLAATARRAQIVAATIETIAELGYPQTSFARIAERAGLSSTRLISYHFAGKDELIGAVVTEVHRTIGRFMAERLADLPDARRALRAYITGVVEFVAGHRAQMQALMEIFLDFRGKDGDDRSYDAATERQVLGSLEEILRWGQATGEFRDFDTFVMAATVQRSVDGLPFLLRTEPELDLSRYADELATIFDLATRNRRPLSEGEEAR